MPTLNLVAELTIEDLAGAVAKLNKAQLAKFTVYLRELRQFRSTAVDKESARIAARRRFPASQRHRLHTLLQKNREVGLTAFETVEIDEYIATFDQALEKTADDLLTLAKQRQQ